MGTPQANYNDQPQAPYTFTTEEKMVLSQCNMESFWYRCVPFSAGALFATQVLLSKGYITASPRFGIFPKYAYAAVFGYIAGKMSYANTCMERLMALENSPAGARLREQRNVKVQGNQPPPWKPGYPEQGFAASVPSVQRNVPPEPEPPSSVYSSKYESSAVEVPFSSTMSESSTTGITDSPAREPEIQEERVKPPPVTYEELRRKNRGSNDVLSPPQTPARPAPTRAPKMEAKKNKYGDVWEE